MKNRIFPTFLPEVALAGTHTAAISAFHTLLTHHGTDRRCGLASLKWLPSHAGWLDCFPLPIPLFSSCALNLAVLLFRHQITMIKTWLRHNGGYNNHVFFKRKKKKKKKKAGSTVLVVVVVHDCGAARIKVLWKQGEGCTRCVTSVSFYV